MGLDGAAFWTWSPREVWSEFEAARLRAEDRRDRDIVLAWRINAIRVQTDNQKRLPALQSLLEPATVPAAVSGVAPTGDGQRAALIAISKKFGIPARPIQAEV